MAGKGTLTVKVLGDTGPFEQSMGKMTKVGAAAFAGLVVAAGAGAGALFKVGASFDTEFDKIRVGTGATGDALGGLEESFKDVARTVPASFGDIGTAIADLNTRTGLTGDDLESLTGQFLNLSRITGTDTKGNIETLTRTFGDWGIATEDQEGALDKLYRAGQASGVGVDVLGQKIVQFGAPLRNLGFSFEESTALMAKFDKEGVNTEGVMSGLKIGVGKLAKAGEDVPETFNRIVGEITKMGPGTEATALAIELFGQRAGPDLADAIAGGKFELAGMLEAIENGEDTINTAAKDTESFGEKWLLFKNKVLVGLEPLATKVFEGVGRAMDKLSGWWETNGPAIISKVQDVALAVGDFVSGALTVLSAWWGENGPAIIGKVTDLKDAIVGWIDEVKPLIQSWISDNLDNIRKWWGGPRPDGHLGHRGPAGWDRHRRRQDGRGRAVHCR